ncbi:hypothetical protein AQS8620_01289 [Aquimixticola soesokkakensis]|uniref:Uncharacterized protein n=1 Tax=Aquimixticola soesokkakensis TaxID=1519096 RepID=A0A1Y5SBU0_9RHOB|nr:hypothetical protein AQS8620_01289 [Aquimixticola soesokkakensis]
MWTIPKLAVALLSIGLLTSCDHAKPIVEVPSELLRREPLTEIPPAGASNRVQAGYVLDSREWMEGADAQIDGLIGVVCIVAVC